MNNSEILKKLLSAVMDVEADETISSATLEAWDSLRHLNLVLALEDEFGVSFTEDESVELFSYADICRVLERHGVSFA